MNAELDSRAVEWWGGTNLDLLPWICLGMRWQKQKSPGVKPRLFNMVPEAESNHRHGDFQSVLVNKAQRITLTNANIFMWLGWVWLLLAVVGGYDYLNSSVTRVCLDYFVYPPRGTPSRCKPYIA